MFEDFRSDPKANPLKTPSGKIEIWSRFIADSPHEDVHPHPRWVEPREWLGSAEVAQLHMVSPQPSSRLHGQLDGVGVSKRSKIKGREPVRINPEDAAERGIGDGDEVRIWNERGECLATASLSENVMAGGIALATGAWYNPEGRSGKGSRDLHGNPNVLTSNVPTSTLSHAPAQHSALVFVEKIARSAYPDIHQKLPKGIAREGPET